MVTITGGDKLARRLSDIGAGLKGASEVRVGFFEGATYPDGTSVAMVAAVQNFGAPAAGIPPRPFFSNMVKDKSPEWPHALELALKATNYDAHAALTLVGEGIKGQLQQAIVDFEGAPLAPSTIAAKGHSSQLVDTGQMLNSAAFEVE